MRLTKLLNLLFNGKKTDYVAMFQFPHQLQLSGFHLDMNFPYKVGKHFDSTHVSKPLTNKQ